MPIANNSPWALKLLKRPLIEVRRGFVLGHEPPTEKSAVIALTLPSGKFVDIRVPKKATETTEPTSVMPSAYQLGPDVYATAGTLTTVIPLTKDTDSPHACPEASACLAHSTWAHDIDSSGGPSSDGADMLLLANGEVLEVGVLELNNGRAPRIFKEFWINEEVDGLPYIAVETVDNSRGSQGRIVRIGPYCQGVLQTKDRFWLERWRCLDSKWIRDSCSTSGRRLSTNENMSQEEEEDRVLERLALPCIWAREDGLRQLGEKLLIDGIEWQVVEIGPQ